MSNTSYVTETVSPADPAAVVEAVRSAGNKRLAVYPIGGGTRLDYGAKPSRPGIGVSLASLNRVVDYPVHDLTITVEAGVTVAELTKHLAAQRQRLPIDIPQPERATIGGAVATNVAGPRRAGYGTMRDYLLGFTAVDAAGVTFSGGGRVVKNAAGYNTCRLMCGSLGTLGVITQATLMVRPLCEASVLLVCDVADLVTAERLLDELGHSLVRPVAVDFVAGQPQTNDVVLGPVLEGNIGRLYVGFEGAETEAAAMVEQLQNRWAAIGATAPMVLPTVRAEPLWRWLTEFPANMQINVLPSAVVSTIDKVLAGCPNCAVQAHAADGVIRLSLPLPPGADRGEGGVKDAIGRLRQIATAAGGKMIVLRIPDDAALTAQDVWGPPGPETRIMQAIKDRFDPENILNPGRFIFG